MNKTSQIIHYLLPVLMLAGVTASLPAQGQDVKTLELNKVKKDHYLYVIGGDRNDVFAGITDNYFVQPDNKFPAVYIDLGNGQEKEETIKPSSNADILYTFGFQNKLYTLEYGNKPFDNGMYPMRMVSYDKNLDPLETVADTVNLTSEAFRYDFSSMFKNQFSPQSGKWRRSYLFSHQESPDGKNLVIMLNNTFQTRPPRTLYYLIFNPQTKDIHQYEVQISSDDENLIVEDYALTNDGKVFFLAGGFDDSFTKKPGTFSYHLYEYDPAMDGPQQVTLETDDHFLTNLGLISSSGEGMPRLAGVYSDNSSLKVSGIAVFTMNGQGVMEGNFTPLEESITGKLYKDDDEDSDQADEYDIRYVFPESGGGLTFFAEHYQRKLGVGVDVSLFGGVSPKPQLEDHYGDILITKVNNDGTPAWTRVIEKAQKSTDENIMFNSFAVVAKNGQYGLVFNEQVKNMSDVTWVNVSGDGTTDRKLIFERKKDRLRVAPMLSGADNQGDLFIPAVRFSNTKLVRVSLP